MVVRGRAAPDDRAANLIPWEGPVKEEPGRAITCERQAEVHELDPDDHGLPFDEPIPDTDDHGFDPEPEPTFGPQVGDTTPSPTPLAPGPTPTPKPTPTFDEEEQSLFDSIDDLRDNLDLPLLTPDIDITNCAREMSADMAEHDYISHTDSNGKNLLERLEDCGIEFSVPVEALAVGGSSIGWGDADRVFDFWVNDESHYVLLTHDSITLAGISRAYDPETDKWYWVFIAIVPA